MPDLDDAALDAIEARAKAALTAEHGQFYDAATVLATVPALVAALRAEREEVARLTALAESNWRSLEREAWEHARTLTDYTRTPVYGEPRTGQPLSEGETRRYEAAVERGLRKRAEDQRDAAIARAEALERRLFPGQGDSYVNEVERQRNVIDGLQHATRSAIARAEAAEAAIAAVRALCSTRGEDAGYDPGSWEKSGYVAALLDVRRVLDTGATTAETPLIADHPGCFCSCHGMPGVAHVVPCCNRPPFRALDTGATP